jgi:DNA replication and repair protein RecF
MYLERLVLTDFRSYTTAEFDPASSGISVVTGSNGAGKTNLIEALAYLATLRSLRGSPVEALVRVGASSAVVRATVVHPGAGGRRLEVAAEISLAGRNRIQVNGQPLRRARDLLGVLQVSVFSPDDLSLVKSGPSVRRDYLDDLLVAVSPRRDLLISEVERILKQRNALLKSVFSPSGGGWRPGRPLPEDVRVTLDVWDSKLAASGSELADARHELVESLGPLVAEAYGSLSSGSAPPGRVSTAMRYVRSWEADPGGLAAALAGSRDDDLRRGVTTVGPHRDELDLVIGGLPARTHASQGEQRTLALALRLAGHRLVTDAVGEAPVLLLDDVFSELDPDRAEALMRNLSLAGPPPGSPDAVPPVQAILTTASPLPVLPGEAGIDGSDTAATVPAARRLRVEDGRIVA